MATYFGATEIPAMLREAGGGVTATVAGVTVYCVVDRSDQTLLQGEVVGVAGKTIEVVVQTATLPGLAVDVDAIVDGVTYTVREVMQGTEPQDDDGALTRFRCEVKP